MASLVSAAATCPTTTATPLGMYAITDKTACCQTHPHDGELNEHVHYVQRQADGAEQPGHQVEQRRQRAVNVVHAAPQQGPCGAEDTVLGVEV